jgi:hypothetical protein
MTVRSSDDRTFWDLDARRLDGYTEVEDFSSLGAHEAEADVATNLLTLKNDRTAPKRPSTPATRPHPGNPNKKPVIVPSTAYTPGVLNCVRGAPPRRVSPKKSG